MIFVGEYDYSVDPQGRVSLPGEWRGEGESSWVALPENDTALLLMSESALLSFFTELQKFSVADPSLRLAAARLGALARSCRCDRQGRLSLARSQLESVGISKNIKLIGAVTHIRVCAPEKWDPEEIDARISGALGSVAKLGNDKGALAALVEGVLDL
jgi:division/cell wall cluster transcriptional repressor MraZ